MSELFQLTIIRKKLVITLQREITIHDLVPVRETLNSIDFILGDDDLWDYIKLSKGWLATVKFRFYYADQILNFIKENKDKLAMDSIDQAYVSDLTKTYRIELERRKEKEIKDMDKDAFAEKCKEHILAKFTETMDYLNALAETMGGIL